jgi:hypothetical protein
MVLIRDLASGGWCGRVNAKAQARNHAKPPLRPCVNAFQVRSIIRKLHIDPEILLAQGGDYLLERIAIFSADTHEIAID